MKPQNILKLFLFSLLLVILIVFGILIVDNEINESKTNTSKKNIENINDNYKRPIVPNGFKKIETKNASWNTDKNGNVKDWNNGLVIEDENGNQFVWVPCTTDINNKSVPLFSRYILDKKNVFSPRNDDILKELHIESQSFIENDPVNKEILISIVDFI